ncbi:meiosis 1 arrest protein isoform X2 [Corythoichthys intestinalis]|uniref:meiosis 1 arrest protein isoform X2 n=1 Tax=Corythoichthys intestinalis TaxID=161448 RepID=UPI0025A4E13D|nr:meiosis 1 arrest protein isoform X2 [Corythoichthys intestinalis]
MDDSNAFGLCNTGFLRQPARLLIVEAVPPWWSETSGVLCDALDNFLTLVCSLKGPCRLPLFSLYSITSRVERLLPFQKVGWANLPNLRACLEDLRSIPGQGITPDLTSVGDFLRNAVLTSLRCLNDDVRFGRTSVSSVQVTVLTSRPGRNMVHLLRNVPKDEAQMLFTSFLVVQLYNWADWSEYELTPENPEVAKSSDSHVPVELKQVENNVFAMEAVFKQWLQEYGRDMEHIQLLLMETPSPVSIKCDIEQCVISPSQVSLKNPDMTASPYNNRSVSQGPRMLKAIKLVHASGICHILFHGTSLIVRSTTNGRQDWEEFETNEQRFQVLNQTLESCGQVLLLQEEFPTGASS